MKSLEEKLSSEKDCCHKAETKQAEIKAKLKTLQKEVKTLGKLKETPVSCEWLEWESSLDSDLAK